MKRFFNERDIEELSKKALMCLPKKCDCIGGEIYYENECLTNFLPVVIRCYDQIDIHDHHSEMMICVGAIKKGKLVGTVDMKQEYLGTLDFQHEISNILYTNTLIKIAIFLGEYPLKNAATNNRIILLQFFKEDLNKEKLNLIRSQPDCMSFFFVRFIRWATENYEVIKCKIQNQFKAYLSAESSKEAYQERLRSHGNTLIMGFNLFLDFCNAEGWEMEYSAEDFKLDTENLIENQIEYLELDGKEKEDYIIPLYLEVRKILDEDERCRSNPKKTNWQQPLYYDGKEERICIPTSTLQDMLENAGIKVTTLTAINDFETANLLITNSNSKVRVRTKKIAKRRCYIIKYDEWTEYVQTIVERDENKTY